MIINAGGRTDLVNYFSDWLFNRFEAGNVCSRNPFCPEQVISYELNPKLVDCVVFCSKNYEPFLKDFSRIYDNFNVFCHYTITAYGKDIEPQVPDIDKSISILKNLSLKIGKQRIVWRYDPVIFTPYYSLEEHCRTFDYISKHLSGYINYALFSFVDIYPRVINGIPEITIPDEEMKTEFCRRIGQTAKKNNIKIQTCATVESYENLGIGLSGCVTAKALGEALNTEFKNVKHVGIRKNCRCLPMRDIGAYNTCMNGCKYCYANTRPSEILSNIARHNPNSPLLIGEIEERDTVKKAKQVSFLKNGTYNQPSLFSFQ
ncbi:MAG: DUF1848 domain-containing protein [Bacteroidales bacterium]|nr:DUF1848 domain-containing protein [Bacteroidales bacterium]